MQMLFILLIMAFETCTTCVGCMSSSALTCVGCMSSSALTCVGCMSSSGLRSPVRCAPPPRPAGTWCTPLSSSPHRHRPRSAHLNIDTSL